MLTARIYIEDLEKVLKQGIARLVENVWAIGGLIFRGRVLEVS